MTTTPHSRAQREIAAIRRALRCGDIDAEAARLRTAEAREAQAARMWRAALDAAMDQEVDGA